MQVIIMVLIQLSMQHSCSLNYSVLNSNLLGPPKSDPIILEQNIVSCYARTQTRRTVPIYDYIMNHTQKYKAVTGDFQEAT